MGAAEVEDAEFGQAASSVVREEPAKLLAVAEIQRTQKEYATALLAGIRDIAREIVPVLSLLASGQFVQNESGLTITLPNGIQVGRQVLRTPADVAAYLQAARQSIQDAAAAADALVEGARQGPPQQPEPPNTE